jgi:hypothetical protein
MITSPEEVEFQLVYDVRFESEAAALVEKAWEAIERTYTANAIIDQKRRARAKRVDDSKLDRQFLAQIVAQWLSACAEAKEAKGVSAGALSAGHRVKILCDEVAEISRQLASLANALRFAEKGENGANVAGLAEVASAALKEAMQPIYLAQECARELIEQLPRRAGKDGGLGALIDGSPDRAVSARDWALTASLARYWTACGLSLKSGDAGDGLDRFLSTIIGENASRKALAAARKSMSI